MKSFREHFTDTETTYLKESHDTICMDIPLFIRLLEYAREDAKTDVALHFVAEKGVELHSKGVKCLGMANYESLVKKKG